MAISLNSAITIFYKTSVGSYSGVHVAKITFKQKHVTAQSLHFSTGSLTHCLSLSLSLSLTAQSTAVLDTPINLGKDCCSPLGPNAPQSNHTPFASSACSTETAAVQRAVVEHSALYYRVSVGIPNRIYISISIASWLHGGM